MYTDHTVIICHKDEQKQLIKSGWKLYKETYSNAEAEEYAEECCYI